MFVYVLPRINILFVVSCFDNGEGIDQEWSNFALAITIEQTQWNTGPVFKDSGLSGPKNQNVMGEFRYWIKSDISLQETSTSRKNNMDYIPVSCNITALLPMSELRLLYMTN